MRLSDLAAPHLTGVSRIVAVRNASLDVLHYLAVPDSCEVVRVEDAEAMPPLSKGDLLAVVHGPDPETHGDAEETEVAIGLLGTGARLLVASGHPLDDTPFHRLLDQLTVASAQVLHAAPLDYALLHAGIVAEAVDRLLPAYDVAGAPVGPRDAEPELRQLLRLSNERTVSDLALRRAQLRLAQEEAESRRHREALEQAAHDRARVTQIEARARADAAERTRLQRRLREVSAEAEAAERRRSALEASASMRVGRLLVGTVHRPRRAVRLPAEAYALWRQRTDRAPALRRRAPATPRRTPAEVPREPFTAFSAVQLGPRDSVVITGVLSRATARALSSAAVVNPTTPHDALSVLRRTDPDLLLVDVAAAAPNEPWAYVGTLVAPDRDRALLELLAEARTRGVPVVVWSSVRRATHPGLDSLLAGDDVLLGSPADPDAGPAWTPGVDLPAGVALGRGEAVTGALWAGDPWTETAPEARAKLWAAIESGAAHGLVARLDELAPGDPDDLPPGVRRLLGPRLRSEDATAAYREAAVLLAPTASGQDPSAWPGRLLAQLLSGARLVAHGAPGAAARFPDVVSSVSAPEDVGAALAAALDAGPLPVRARRSVLRDAVGGWSTVASVAALARHARVRSECLASDTVAVVAPVDGAEAADAAVRAALRQVRRPDETLLFGTPSATDGAVSALRAEGLRARGCERPVTGDLLRHAAGLADSAWLRLWSPPPRGTRDLLDLMVGQACSGADAVGYGDEDLVFVSDLPSGDSVVRRNVAAVEGCADGAALAPWSRRGHRLLSLARLDGEGDAA
jgi:hypothetical protein